MRKILFVLSAWIMLLTSWKIVGQTSGTYNEYLSQYKDAENIIAQIQGKEMSKEEEEKILKTMSAEMRSKLEEIKKLNKNKYYQLLRSSFPFGYLSTAFSNQEVYTGLLNSNESLKKEKDLEIDAELLALKIKNADGNTQQKLKSELAGVLNQLFDIRESKKESEIKQLEKRLQDLKESIQARKQNKNEIVQRRIQEMLGDSRYLRWE